MFLFLGGILLLAVGYLTYGRFVEKVLGPDGRDTPAKLSCDGVDYVVLPHWRNMLIQLLNIAGIGPVIGVILGIKFGTIVFIIIPIGNIIAGAVHDFLGGMISLRHNGANLPAIVKMNLGRNFAHFFSVFMVFLLLLVVAVFINVPATLIDKLIPEASIFWVAVGAIFLYYICATLFPVDKIIGAVYPFFGAVLLLGTFAIFIALVIAGVKDPALFTESAGFREHMFTPENYNPIIPMLFVTIACGIISGFHATQSPIIARTMASEYQARSSFYGMMIVEGVIAMIWAAAGLAIYNLFPEKMLLDPNQVLNDITRHFLGTWMGGLTVIGVIVLAITSGDTAMRSLRLSLAEIFHLPQHSLRNRFLLCIPLIVIVAFLLAWSNKSAQTFKQLWNYFAWGNQVLAASTLMAAAVWLASLRKNLWIAIVPGVFMTFIVTTYILWISPSHSVGGAAPMGFGLPLNLAYLLAGVISLAFALWVYRRGKRLARESLPPEKTE